LSGTPNIRGYSWRAVKLVLEAAKACGCKPTCRNSKLCITRKKMKEVEAAIKRVEQMLEEEPERFIEV
jgi:hypothetical protein